MPENKTYFQAEDSRHLGNEIRNNYFALYPYYSRLGANIVEALEFFLKDQGISTVSVSYRVKSLQRFLEKIRRKNYDHPFIQTTDLCGVRVICYFQRDVDSIANIIRREFNVIESRQKEKDLNPTQFGYRSHHYIVKIKPNWTYAPNYRHLEDYQAEIQVRTILMHAWAEIEHKLAYKRDVHIPDELRRKFSLLSAKLEEADEQFEELATLIHSSKQSLIEQAKKQKVFSRKVGLNLDSLQAFLDYYFPDKNRNIRETRDLLDEMIKRNITLGELVDAYEKFVPEDRFAKEDSGKGQSQSQKELADYIMKKAEERRIQSG